MAPLDCPLRRAVGQLSAGFLGKGAGRAGGALEARPGLGGPGPRPSCWPAPPTGLLTDGDAFSCSEMRFLVRLVLFFSASRLLLSLGKAMPPQGCHTHCVPLFPDDTNTYRTFSFLYLKCYFSV